MALVEQRAEVVPVTAACEALDVSRASLYLPQPKAVVASADRACTSAESATTR